MVRAASLILQIYNSYISNGTEYLEPFTVQCPLQKFKSLRDDVRSLWTMHVLCLTLLILYYDSSTTKLNNQSHVKRTYWFLPYLISAFVTSWSSWYPFHSMYSPKGRSTGNCRPQNCFLFSSQTYLVFWNMNHMFTFWFSSSWNK